MVVFITPGLPSVLWCCWLGGRKGIQPVKKLSGEVPVWLSVWSEVLTHMAQLMPLPLTVCVCVRVSLCVCVCLSVCVCKYVTLALSLCDRYYNLNSLQNKFFVFHKNETPMTRTVAFYRKLRCTSSHQQQHAGSKTLCHLNFLVIMLRMPAKNLTCVWFRCTWRNLHNSWSSCDDLPDVICTRGTSSSAWMGQDWSFNAIYTGISTRSAVPFCYISSRKY